jgi:hypothetical protein
MGRAAWGPISKNYSFICFVQVLVPARKINSVFVILCG